MRVLLDTNILIHRETWRTVRNDIGVLFYWLDQLGYNKIVHPLSLEEIKKHQDPNVVSTMETKLKNYYVLKTEAPEESKIQAIRTTYGQRQLEIHINDN